MKHSGWLSFRQIECRGCSAKRIVGIPCGVCGKEPDEREVDPNRQARQRAAESALEVLEAAGPLEVRDSPGSEPLEFFPRLEEFADSFTSSLVATAQNARHSERLIAAVNELRKIRAAAAAAPRLRPWIATWRAIDEVLDRLQSVARHFLLALAAEVPIAAQREAEAAQVELDAAAEPAVFVGDRMERWSSMDAADTFEDGLTVMTAHAFVTSGAGDLLDFDRAGAAVFERVTGRTDCPTGLGFGLNIIAQQAEGPFDEARFWRVAKETFVRLTAEDQWLGDLVANEAWRNDLRSAMTKAWDGGVLNQGMAAAIRHERHAVRVSLELVEGLVETCGKMFAATLIAATKSKDYGSYGSQSAGSLIIQVNEQSGLTELFTGLDAAIRRASAHQEFSVEGDTVVLMNMGAEVDRLSRDELVDRTFSSIESVNAIGLGVVCAAVIGGVDADGLFGELSDYVDPATGVAVMLAGGGWKSPEVSIVDDRAVVTGEADIGPRPLTLVATLIPHLPTECQELQLTATSSTGVQELRGPLEPLRQFASKVDDMEKQVRLAEAHRLWRLNGVPLCTDDQVRQLVSAVILQRVDQLPARESVRFLLSVRAAIECLDLGDVEDAIGRVLRALRGELIGLATPGELEVALEPLRSWVNLRVDPLGT